jgi:hypothetical protein
MERHNWQKVFGEAISFMNLWIFVGLFSAPEVTNPTTIETSVLATTFASDTVDNTQRSASSTTFTPGWFVWFFCSALYGSIVIKLAS